MGYGPSQEAANVRANPKRQKERKNGKGNSFPPVRQDKPKNRFLLKKKQPQRGRRSKRSTGLPHTCYIHTDSFRSHTEQLKVQLR